MEVTTRMFKIIMIDSSGNKQILTLNNPIDNIDIDYIKTTFLARATPVLGITAIDDAYYFSTTKETLN